MTDQRLSDLADILDPLREAIWAEKERRGFTFKDLSLLLGNRPHPNHQLAQGALRYGGPLQLIRLAKKMGLRITITVESEGELYVGKAS